MAGRAGVRLLISALASSQIGTGHLRRMSTLAEGFMEAGVVDLHLHSTALGAEILANHPILSEHFTLHLAPDDPAVAMAQLADLVRDLRPGALVVDNYIWDATTETLLRQSGMALCIIDDLANRPHDCDVLIDQNANQTAAAYRGLVPPECRLGVGGEFCLLPRPFRDIRAAGILDPEKRIDLNQIFVSLGGGDPHGDLLPLVECLLELSDRRLSIATGSHIRDAGALRDLVGRFPGRIDLALDSDRVPHQMQHSAWAVAAGGTMTWERAVLGVPTLCVVIADNQEATAAWLAEKGMHRVFDMRGGWSRADFASAYRAFVTDRDFLCSASARSSTLVGARGVHNAVELILSVIPMA